jgi:hypothetical protein
MLAPPISLARLTNFSIGSSSSSTSSVSFSSQLLHFPNPRRCAASLSVSSPPIMQGGYLSKKSYEPPSWASHLSPIPSHTFSLGHVSVTSDLRIILPAPQKKKNSFCKVLYCLLLITSSLLQFTSGICQTSPKALKCGLR